MKTTNRMFNRLRRIMGVLALAVALTVGLFLDASTITSLADSSGKVTASSAKIRKEPSTTSDTVGSASQNTVVSVKGQITGSDGQIWYQVSVAAGATGYIRSDLMEITDGTTPATIVSATVNDSSSNANTSNVDSASVEVTALEPVSASVSGTSAVRVLQTPSTTGRIVSTVEGGLALTVNGVATGADGNEWYQVSFISNGSEVNGYIRSAYVSVNGELLPEGTVKEPEAQTEQESQTTQDKSKDWDTYYQNGTWHLLDNSTGNSYDINQIFETVEANNSTLQDVLATNQIQQIAVIALVILAVILFSVISVLAFKLRDAKDAYYEEVSKAAARKRTADRPAERPAGGQKQRPAGSGSGAQKPSGQRPASSSGNSVHKTSGQRPASGAGQKSPAQRATEPAAQKQTPSGQRPVKRQAVENESIRTLREEEVQDIVSAEAENVVREAEREVVRREAVARTQEQTKHKPRNFADDDEFEFQFLDWDEDQE